MSGHEDRGLTTWCTCAGSTTIVQFPVCSGSRTAKIEMFVMSCLIAEPYGVALVQGDGGAEQGQDWLEADCAPTEAVERAVEQ